MLSRYIPSNRTFNNDASLKKHEQFSRAHLRCVPCNRPFKSRKALQQHLQTSPAHAAISATCSNCNQTFSSENALQQHLQNPTNHQQPATQTPLDVFFHSFPTFQYDPSLSPNTSYKNLQRHERWSRGDPMADKTWDTYQTALQSELEMWYSAENDLTAWHVLCRAVSILPLPTSCEECERAVQTVHVNIIDLIAWGRSGSEEEVQVFDSVEELGAYTRETEKVFRMPVDRRSGNMVLRHLLRKIFRRRY